MVEGENSLLEYIKFLVVIASIVIITQLFFAYGSVQTTREWMRVFMGIFFIVFACFKFAGYSMFAEMFAGYDVVAKQIRLYAFAYPFIELGLGLLYLLNIGGQARDVVALAVMAVGSIGVFREVSKRSGIHCACLGNVIKLPLSTVSLVEDVGMGIMALVMIFLG
jgi:hypothetical protein